MTARGRRDNFEGQMTEIAYFISDLHITRSGDKPAVLFLSFLRELNERANTSPVPIQLFLVGDIFDLWIGGHDYFVNAFSEIVTSIRALVKNGVTVHYFEGNHDLHLATFWQNEVGAKVHADAATFMINGKIVRVEHGDLINPNDKGYLFLRAFLRTAPLKALSLNLPSAIVKAIGESASRASRAYTSNQTGSKGLPEESIRNLIRAHAMRVGRHTHFDLLIAGHVHVTDDETFDVDGREIRSVNLGSWFDGAKAFVLDQSGGRFQIIQ